ncbi:MAG: MFS transporter [Thermoprotei archaeon]
MPSVSRDIARRAVLVFILLSLVSLFGDIAYEGGRSVSGQYLEVLGAPALAAGVLGIGEFLAYAIRLPASLVISVKKSNRLLWAMVILGYSLIIAIPLIALTRNWYLVLALYFIERIGKGLRSPARDVVVADITDKAIGRGKGFGIHEVLDQVGAVLGPLAVSSALIGGLGYSYAYLILLPPVLLAVALVTTASVLYPRIGFTRKGAGVLTGLASGEAAKKYLVFTGLLSLGFMHWGLISYHVKRIGIVSEDVIPLYYALAMGVDAVVAIPLGILYDRYGLEILLAIPLASLPIAPLVLLAGNPVTLGIASALLGIVLCSYDSVLKAAAADFTPSASERALLFGWLGFVWGISWAIGNATGGALYDYLGPLTLSIFYPLITLVSLVYMLSIVKTKDLKPYTK